MTLNKANLSHAGPGVSSRVITSSSLSSSSQRHHISQLYSVITFFFLLFILSSCLFFFFYSVITFLASQRHHISHHILKSISASFPHHIFGVITIFLSFIPFFFSLFLYIFQRLILTLLRKQSYFQSHHFSQQSQLYSHHISQ